MKILLLALPTTLDHLVPMFESEGHDVRLLTNGPENMSLYVSECYNYIIEQISEFEPDHIVNAVVNLHFELGIDTYPWIFNVLQNTPESAALEHNRYNARTLAREHGGFELAPLLIEQTGDLLSLPINESQEQFVKPRNFLDECIVVPPNTEFSLQYDSYVEADVDPDVEAWCFFTMCGDKYSIIRTIASTGAKENKTLGSGTSFPEGVTLIDLTDEQETLFLEKCNAWLNYAKLSYEIGNPFKSVAQVLQNFLQKYPTSKASEEINNLVIASFLHQQDYSGALAFIEQKKTTKNNPIIAEINLYKGMQLFNEDKLKEAHSFFIKGQKATELLIKEKAKYWEAETLYQLKKYNKALNKFILLRNSGNGAIP